MNELAVKQESVPAIVDARMVAREMAAAFRDRVNRYKHAQGLSTPEAVAKAEEPCSFGRALTIVGQSPEETTWPELEELNRGSPVRALDRWEEVKQFAREELRSGNRAAAVLEGRDSSPWKRAQFLAIREELTEGWQPRNGVERQLIDQMAQAQAMMNFCLERLAYDAFCGGTDAAEQVAAMADRFNKMFQRTLRALLNLRRVPLAVVVQNAGQVNVGGQQVNVAGES
jgi:hypothetical protein